MYQYCNIKQQVLSISPIPNYTMFLLYISVTVHVSASISESVARLAIQVPLCPALAFLQ